METTDVDKMKKLSTIRNQKMPKNRVIHEVIHIIHRLFHTGKNLVGKRLSTLCTGFSTGRKRSFTPEQKSEYNLHNVKM